jgi:hypothetical protein
MSTKKTRIMYIEDKSGGIVGHARIGRVTFSKTMRSLTYQGKEFIKAEGFKSNYVEVESGAEHWISGPKKRGQDQLYSTGLVNIDEDVREEYWTKIRNAPSRRNQSSY